MSDFFDLIEQKKPDERKKLKARILRATGAANPTWYSWLQNQKVSSANQVLISNELGIPREILFPNN